MNILQSKEILARLKLLLNIKSDSDLASMMGVNIGRIHNWKNRNTIPTDEIASLCIEHNIDLHEVLLGEKYQSDTVEPKQILRCEPVDPKKTRDTFKSCCCGQLRIAPPLGKYRLVDESNGFNEEYRSAQIVDLLAPDLVWVNHALGIAPEHFLLVKVIGDNMSPWAHDGDLVMVDTSIKSTINGGCLVLRYSDGTMMIRRVFRNPDGTFYAKSDTECCEPDIIDPSKPGEFPAIVGRVIRRVVR